MRPLRCAQVVDHRVQRDAVLDRLPQRERPAEALRAGIVVTDELVITCINRQ